jgi:hypothetical protein
MTTISGRNTTAVPPLAERQWNDVRAPLERFLRSARDSIAALNVTVFKTDISGTSTTTVLGGGDDDMSIFLHMGA